MPGYSTQSYSRTDSVSFSDGLRRHMTRIYNLMAGGLAVTGLVSLLFALNKTLFESLYYVQNGMLKSTVLGLVVMFAPLVMLLIMRPMAKGGGSALSAMYWAFCAVMGASLSYIFHIYTGGSIVQVFFVTSAAFGSLSLYGYVTKRDLSAMGAFMAMGLVGILIASIVNIFLKSPGLYWAVTYLGVMIFAGLTAWDTQKLKQQYLTNYQVIDTNPAIGRQVAIFGAVSLYLDFINLFLFLLRIMGDRR